MDQPEEARPRRDVLSDMLDSDGDDGIETVKTVIDFLLKGCLTGSVVNSVEGAIPYADPVGHSGPEGGVLAAYNRDMAMGPARPSVAPTISPQQGPGGPR